VQRGSSVVLRVPFPVDGVAADDGRAAIAPAHDAEGDYAPTPPILVWRPGRGAAARLLASGCTGVDQLVVLRERLAFDCNYEFVDIVAQSVWVVDPRTRVPREVFLGHAGSTGGLYLDHVVGGDDVVAFGSDTEDARGNTVRRCCGGSTASTAFRSTRGERRGTSSRRTAATSRPSSPTAGSRS
jgi:hypothetical protein